jgi:hypothetical protein
MRNGSDSAHRPNSVVSDPVVAILIGLAAISLVSRVWLLVAHFFR